MVFYFGNFNLFSFYYRDHGPRNGNALRPWVETELSPQAWAPPPDQVFLLVAPRFLGYVFNPLSIYYYYDDERLSAIVYEVKNTFGEQHPYVLAVPPQPIKSDRFYQCCAKTFHVSPFLEAEGNCRFDLRKPDDKLEVRISVHVEAGALLVATMQGRRLPLTDRQLLFQALMYPFTPLKVVASIHYQALRLWLKDISLQPQKVRKK